MDELKEILRKEKPKYVHRRTVRNITSLQQAVEIPSNGAWRIAIRNYSTFNLVLKTQSGTAFLPPINAGFANIGEFVLGGTPYMRRDDDMSLFTDTGIGEAVANIEVHYDILILNPNL